MCGRINVSDNDGVRLLLEMLGMDVWPSRDPRFNVAPTSLLDVVVANSHGKPTHGQMQWGLKAPWARPGKPAAPLINARGESLFEKPTFRELARVHRIAIPVTGYYEWRREGKAKTPYLIRSATEPALLFAGISQPALDESDMERACIVTTSANEKLSAVHHRMPVLMDSVEALAWLSVTDNNELKNQIKPASNNTVYVEQVSDYVNSTRNQGSKCQEAADDT